MIKLNNAMEIFKLLDKSNCKKCNEPTCLAFASAVFQGKKQLDECPNLDSEIIKRYGGQVVKQVPFDREFEESLKNLKEKIATIDLASSAQRLGATFSNEKIIIKCLGKDFSVDTAGNITTDIHVNPWITMPVFNYIISGKGVPVSGKWVPLRELQGGKKWYKLFGQTCEKPLKKIADTHTSLFKNMIEVFNGKPVKNHYSSDISLVLHPLPKVPVLICYWKPEEGLESDLNIFFDSTAEENLNIEALYTLATGLTTMFSKFALTHG